MPNFLIIGAARAGTTALYDYLRQHPQIYMSPVKESGFFALEGEKIDFRGSRDMEKLKRLGFCVTDIKSYRTLFRNVSNEKAIGEASVLYLYSPKSPERIKSYISDVKLIAILRDPVERAYSHFLKHIREKRETISDFARAIKEEENRIRMNWEWGWHYVRMGFYYAQLKRYFDIFNKNQIKVYLYEDFKTNPTSVLQDIFEFLRVGEAFVPNMSSKYNTSDIFINPNVHTFIARSKVSRILKSCFPAKLRQHISDDIIGKNLTRPSLSPEVRKHLIGVYAEDILKLQDLISRDLSKWLDEQRSDDEKVRI